MRVRARVRVRVRVRFRVRVRVRVRVRAGAEPPLLLPPGAVWYVLRLLISRSRPKEISEPSCAPDQGDTWEI